MGQAASRQEAFWEACGFGHVGRVKRYIEEGIDVNWVSYTHDCCPIHVASQGKPEVVRLLLEQDCNVNVLDIRGNTPLHHAAMKGHSEIMQTLISAGCKIDTEDKNGWTALHNAAYWCHYKAIKVLLKNKCDITITNKDSRTALHEVARSKETEEITLGEIARLLIQAGIDINARGSDLGEADFTGLMFASYHGHYDVASAFVEAGCDLNACGASNNWSALHWAADRGQDELVYLLLEAGIDPTIKNYRAETAADRAKSPEVKEMIINAINMFEEMKGLDLPVSSKSKSTSTSNSQTSPTKNKVTNHMLDNIFSKMPPIGNRPQHSSNHTAAGDSPTKGTSSNSKGSEGANQISVSGKVTNQKTKKSSPVAEETNDKSAFKSVIDKLSSEINKHTKISDKASGSKSKDDNSDDKDSEDIDVKLSKFKTLSDIEKMEETKTSVTSEVKDTNSSQVKDNEISKVKDSDTDIEKMEETKTSDATSEVKDKNKSQVKDTDNSQVKDDESSKGKDGKSDSEDIDVKLPKFKTLSDIEKMEETKTSSATSEEKDGDSKVKDSERAEVKDNESSEVKDTDNSKVKDEDKVDAEVSLPKLKKVSEIDKVKEINTSKKENKEGKHDTSKVKDTDSSKVKGTKKSKVKDTENSEVQDLDSSDDGFTELHAAGLLLGVMKVASQNAGSDDNSDDEKSKTGINDTGDDGKGSNVREEEEADEVMKVASENLVEDADDYSD